MEKNRAISVCVDGDNIPNKKIKKTTKHKIIKNKNKSEKCATNIEENCSWAKKQGGGVDEIVSGIKKQKKKKRSAPLLLIENANWSSINLTYI